MILTFHYHGQSGAEVSMLPSYYIDGEYDAVAVRLNAVDAPIRDAKFNIYDDGVSIFANKTATTVSPTTGIITSGSDTDILLPAGENEDEIADSFTDSLFIQEGSWVTCKLIDAGGGKDFTVQLELAEVGPLQ